MFKVKYGQSSVCANQSADLTWLSFTASGTSLAPLQSFILAPRQVALSGSQYPPSGAGNCISSLAPLVPLYGHSRHSPVGPSLLATLLAPLSPSNCLKRKPPGPPLQPLLLTFFCAPHFPPSLSFYPLFCHYLFFSFSGTFHLILLPPLSQLSPI